MKKILNISSFKPYYKWITFNTMVVESVLQGPVVLNLIINGLPSILKVLVSLRWSGAVLNLIINGLPSILLKSNTRKNIKI